MALKARCEDEKEEDSFDEDNEEEFVSDYFDYYKSPLESIDELLYFEQNLKAISANQPEYY